MSAKSEIAQLRGPILRSVSRSFYLSIRMLPADLRDPIALAYLLARATDTIADTAEIDVDLRAHELASLAEAIQTASPGKLVSSAMICLQPSAAERNLLERVPDCLAWLESLPQSDREDVKDVLLKINEGQTFDLQRFRNTTAVTALATAADLDRYTYLVAGSVGEFWTTICYRHVANFASRAPEEMRALGVAYGKGLQLVNILRDIGSDLHAGRCYLPAEELAAMGLTPEDVVRQPARALPSYTQWRERAERYLRDGLEYACAITPFRVRLATALPALIGIRTLALLREAGTGVFSTKVKVSRKEVRAILLKTGLNFASAETLRKMFRSSVR